MTAGGKLRIGTNIICEVNVYVFMVLRFISRENIDIKKALLVPSFLHTQKIETNYLEKQNFSE